MEVGDILLGTFVEDMPTESIVSFLGQLCLKVFPLSVMHISFAFESYESNDLILFQLPFFICLGLDIIERALGLGKHLYDPFTSIFSHLLLIAQGDDLAFQVFDP